MKPIGGAVSKFYRLLARLRRRYPGLVEKPTLSTLVLKTKTLAYMVVKALEMAGGRYTLNRSISLKPISLEAYIPQSQ